MTDSNSGEYIRKEEILPKEGRAEVKYEGRFLRLLKEGRWEYVDRINSTGAVMIVAVTPERELIMVEEYRVPLHTNTLGLPAGISGDMGEESLLKSAIRELEEESGYRSDSWTYLGEGPSSPGLTSEMISFFMADSLKQVSQGGGVGEEGITVHKIALENVHEWLTQERKKGKAIDPRIYMALYFVGRYEKGLFLYDEKEHEL